MGLAPSSSLDQFEPPSEKHEATLYYFSGRGLADQIRWMLAANQISFTQKIISQRSQLLKMSARQLPFGQLPLLQIDGIEIVQSQAAVRYLARRGGLQGRNDEEVLKCDMIAEAVKDLVNLITQAPFKRITAKKQRQAKQLTESSQAAQPPSLPVSVTVAANATTAVPVTPSPPTPNGNTTQKNEISTADSSTVSAPQLDVWEQHLNYLKEKWQFIGQRFEAIIRANTRALRQKNEQDSNSSNNSKSNEVVYDPNSEYFLVGDALTYADILVAHITTWYVEECGSEIVAKMPFLVHLQNQVISLPGVKQFIKSSHYFPLGDEAYVNQVQKVLAKNLV